MFDLHDPKNVSHVRKLYYKRFAWQVEKMGLDPEDVLQDVYTTILHRNDPNSGCTPYDPARGCASNYLFKVIVSIIYHARRVKYRTKRGAALATALPLHAEDGGEFFDAPWLPGVPSGGGGDVWALAAEQAGLSVGVLRECADGRDLEKEAREEERRQQREQKAAAKLAKREAEAAALAAKQAKREARTALKALSPEARAERDRAYNRDYYHRCRKQKWATPTQD